MVTPRIPRRDFLAGAVKAGVALGALGAHASRGASIALAEPEAPPVPAARTDRQPEKPAPFIVDVHCHTFSVLDLPVDGFALAFLHGVGLPNFGDPVVGAATEYVHRKLVAIAKGETGHGDSNTEQVRAILESDALKHLMRLAGAEDPLGTQAQAITQTLELITRPRIDIAKQLCADYPSVALFMPALVDYEHWVDRGRKGTARAIEVDLDEQITAHGKVFAEINRQPDQPAMHGYVPFNPLRQLYCEQRRRANPGGKSIDAMAEIRRAIGIGDSEPGEGFIGVKLYPASGFLPLGNADSGEFRDTAMGRDLDRVMRDFFALCQAHEIPIISHSSAGNGFGRNYAWRGSPWGWRQALKEFPNLRLDLAHFGHLEGVPNDDGGVVLDCLSWSQNIANVLMPEHAHLYADLGFSPIHEGEHERKRYEKHFVEQLLQRDPALIANRVMYGTDWWLVNLVGNHHAYLSNMRTAMKDLAERAARRSGIDACEIERKFFGENALRFIGILDSDNALNKRGLAYLRLAKYYEQKLPDVPLPEWMKVTPAEISVCRRPSTRA